MDTRHTRRLRQRVKAATAGALDWAEGSLTSEYLRSARAVIAEHDLKDLWRSAFIGLVLAVTTSPVFRALPPEIHHIVRTTVDDYLLNIFPLVIDSSGVLERQVETLRDLGWLEPSSILAFIHMAALLDQNEMLGRSLHNEVTFAFMAELLMRNAIRARHILVGGRF